MYNKKLLLLAALILLISAYFLLNRSNENEIRLRLDDLAEALSFKEPLSPLEQLSKAKKLRSFFAESIELEFQLEGSLRVEMHENQEVQEKSLLLFSSLKSFEFTYRDLLFIEKDVNIKLELSIYGLGEGKQNHGRFLEAHRVEVVFIKIDNEWKIIRMSQLQNLRA